MAYAKQVLAELATWRNEEMRKGNMDKARKIQQVIRSGKKQNIV